MLPRSGPRRTILIMVAESPPSEPALFALEVVELSEPPLPVVELSEELPLRSPKLSEEVPLPPVVEGPRSCPGRSLFPRGGPSSPGGIEQFPLSVVVCGPLPSPVAAPLPPLPSPVLPLPAISPPGISNSQLVSHANKINFMEPSAPGLSAASPTTSIFTRSDPTLQWINSHPYEDCGALGQGSFGFVRKVKLLTPLGYTIKRSSQGFPLFKDIGGGDMLLRKMTEHEWTHLVGGDWRTLQEEVSRAKISEVGWAEHLNFSGLACASKEIFEKSEAGFHRCLWEVRLMEKLRNCEHIVRVYDSEAVLKIRKVTIVMELGEMDFGQYLKSRSLSEHDEGEEGKSGVLTSKPQRDTISQTDCPDSTVPMDAFEIFAWWRQMVAGMQAVHTHDIIHGDVKPNNFIMVRRTRGVVGGGGADHEEYSLKLADFGMSRKLEDFETHLSVVNAFGSPLYMAPEVLHTTEAHCKLHITKAVDIWGLGVVLHQMLHNGSTPYGHLAKYGKWRVIVAIPDQKAARVRTKCPRLLVVVPPPPTTVDTYLSAQDQTGVVPGGQAVRFSPSDDDFLRMPIDRVRHDLLLGLQLSCLQRGVAERPTAVHLSTLNSTAKPFFRSSSREEEGRSSGLDDIVGFDDTGRTLPVGGRTDREDTATLTRSIPRPSQQSSTSFPPAPSTPRPFQQSSTSFPPAPSTPRPSQQPSTSFPPAVLHELPTSTQQPAPRNLFDESPSTPPTTPTLALSTQQQSSTSFPPAPSTPTHFEKQTHCEKQTPSAHDFPSSTRGPSQQHPVLHDLPSSPTQQHQALHDLASSPLSPASPTVATASPTVATVVNRNGKT